MDEVKTPYNCECVDRVNAALLRKYDGKFILWEQDTIATDSDEMDCCLTLPFRKIKTDRIAESGLRPNYCPFCGKKYKRDKKVKR